jgi:hypothetical protein
MSQKLEELESVHEKVYQKGLLSKYNNVEIVAYIGAALSALTATWLSIGRMFADKLEKEGLLGKIREIKAKDYRNSFGGNATYTISQSIEKMQAIEKKYRDSFNQIAKEKFGAVSTFDKWQLLRPHQKIQTAATFLGILVIAGVAAYTQEQQEHKETKAGVQRIEEKIEEIKENTTPAEEPSVPAGAKTEAVLKQREAAKNIAETSVAPAF